MAIKVGEMVNHDKFKGTQEQLSAWRALLDDDDGRSLTSERDGSQRHGCLKPRKGIPTAHSTASASILIVAKLDNS